MDAGLFDSGSRPGQTFPHIPPAVYSLSQTCPTLARAELGAQSDRHTHPVLSGHLDSVSVATIRCLAPEVTFLRDTLPGLPSHQGRLCLAALLEHCLRPYDSILAFPTTNQSIRLF